MKRVVAGILAALLLTTSVVLFVQSRASASEAIDLPAMPTAEEESETRELPVIPEIAEPPEADPLSKEEKRFNRVDKDRDEAITLSELVHPRRKAFAKLDLDGDGSLRFEEWAIRTIEKFDGADADGNGLLTRAEYATTAPKPRKPKPACSC
ncbi:hypothetical protein [Sphingomicrobium nitratireducens]|uniref:hypothetical protein n=1 Tax=Sphingomicrobium nitratireducens TaxID=2964666 RepID=UPI0022401FFB|nr:hypothetical protein [Sphingomicrobium nitratireducens]